MAIPEKMAPVKLISPIKERAGHHHQKSSPVTNFLKLHCFQFKSAHLLISSPQGERMKVRGVLEKPHPHPNPLPPAGEGTISFHRPIVIIKDRGAWHSCF